MVPADRLGVEGGTAVSADVESRHNCCECGVAIPVGAEHTQHEVGCPCAVGPDVSPDLCVQRGNCGLDVCDLCCTPCMLGALP